MTTTLRNVRQLAPAIAEQAAEIERAGAVPAELIQALKTAGVFRMYVPRTHGGDEMTPTDVVPVIQELARADGSVGWIATIGVNSPALFSYLQPTAYDEIYAQGPDVIQAGSLVPRGRAVPAEGGYRFSGQWPFVSGCEHADYVGFSAVVERASSGPPSAGPRETRIGMVSADQVEILDTWHVSGLKGTGSHDIRVEDLFVPDEWTGSLTEGPPVIRHPLDAVPPLGRLGLELAAVAVGIAQGAVDDLVAIGTSKKPLGGLLGPLAKDPMFQYKVGRLDLELRTAQLVLSDVAQSDHARVSAGLPLEQRELLERRTALCRVAEMAATIVDGCYHASGTTGLYETSPLQRRLRDVRALTQHILFTSNPFSPAGALLLGEHVDPTMF